MREPDKHPLRRALDLSDDPPSSDELLRRLAGMCFRARERERRDPNYAVPEWVEAFGSLNAGIQSGHGMPKLWRQGQRRRHWGWLTMWFWLPVELVRMRRFIARLPPGAKVVASGMRWR